MYIRIGVKNGHDKSNDDSHENKKTHMIKIMVCCYIYKKIVF